MCNLWKKCGWLFIAAFVVLMAASASSYAKDVDNNPPGAKGGPGTNWENPPGAAGGQGASPDVKGQPPYHRHSHFCQKQPWHKKCQYNPQDRDNNPPGAKGGPGTNWENPPGAKGGPGASPNRKPPKPR